MEIVGETRNQFKKKVKLLRAQKKLPAVVYGAGLESTSLIINTNNFVKTYRETGDTGLIDLKFGKNSEKVLVKDVQIHPVSSAILHVSFLKVDLTEKISAQIPVEIIGEEECEVIKSGEGLLLVLLNEIEVEALPENLPHSFKVDVSGLTEIEQGVTIAELSYDKGKVEILGLEDEDLVVKIDYAQMADEVEEEEVSEQEAIAGIEATEELSEEEKAERAEKEASEKKEHQKD